MTVAELLRQSMAAHNQYKQLARQRDIARAREALTLARDLRKQAIEMDPDRSEPCWAEEQGKTATGVDTHDALTQFYAEQLAR